MRGRRGDSWVVVTGATGGIGNVLIASLAGRGQDVIAMARRPERLAAGPGPGRIVAVPLDLTRAQSIDAATQQARQIIGEQRLAGLVNLAGILIEGPLESLPVAELRRQLETNVVGPFALTQALLPLLRQGRGRVVNIGSISAHLTLPFYGPIAASKAALAALNDAMRLEFARFAINVILIEPAAIKTAIFETSRAARDTQLLASPEQERQYRPALVTMDRALDNAGADDPQLVVAAIMQALYRRRPKAKLVVGKNARFSLMLSGLPTRWRDRLLIAALGLNMLRKPPANRA